ncbi:MAG TPA: DIP1984 family protein [Ktedonobacterales bacterium]|nr:DIP1984 family protein [Ktedonobacterales bacterium]
MKLAEALTLRADIQKRISGLGDRIEESARVQEGEQPPENPQELLAQLDELFGQLASLIARINRTNLSVRLPNGVSLTDALAQRDTLALRFRTLDSIADEAAEKQSRYSRSEIKMVSTLNVSALRKQLDEIAQQRRELDTQIQATNWTADLLEE